MSTRSELRTLIRLAPELNIDVLSNVNLNTLLDKGQIDLGLKGRALPRNEQVNTVASQQEYVVSGTSPVLTADDFLGIDLVEGGVLYYDGATWRGRLEGFQPKTKEWLDGNSPGWRSNSATSSPPQYWY